MWNRWRKRLVSAGISAVWLSAVIHWTIRDSIHGLAFVFYATPPIILGILALPLAWLGTRWRTTEATAISITTHRATAVLGIFCLAQWVGDNFRSGSPWERRPSDLKVVFWNVGRSQFASWDRIAAEARGFEADVLAFGEADSDGVQSREFWESNFPEYVAALPQAGLVLLVKGRAQETARGSLAGRGNFRHLSLDVRGTRLDILMADLASHPFRSRDRPLKALYAIMRKQASIPTLVVGDFNTPPDSVWFDDWRTDWHRAWEVAGHGYQATWPQPLPVLTLDHVWGNDRVAIRSCKCGWTRCSDHRPVIVEIEINDRQGIDFDHSHLR